MSTSSPTIFHRFAGSVLLTLLRSIVIFSTGLILARWLGPSHYGSMTFLLASMMAIKQVIDLASSNAFFTFLSKKKRTFRFIRFYWLWLGIQFIVMIFLVKVLLPETSIELFWNGENRNLVVLSFVAMFMQNIAWNAAAQMAEANRKTIQLQKLNFVIVLIHLAVVIVLYLNDVLYVPILFISIAIEWGIASWVASKMYEPSDLILESETSKYIFQEFWVYCWPFLPYAFIGFAHDFIDRWMLQHWGGSIQQAYFSVAQQFAAVALLATTSFLRIFWKEIAEAQHIGDFKKIERLFKMVSFGLFLIGALVSGGLLPWAKEIVTFLLGSAFTSGSFTLMLMFLYPVHQSLGQIGGTILYATENGKLQVRLGVVFLISNILFSYILLAPNAMKIPGFEMGSLGLSLKMVVMQIVNVNIMYWFIAKKFNWKFEWKFQYIILAFTVLFGWISKLAITTIFAVNPIIMLILSLILYSLICFSLLYYSPSILGEEYHSIFKNFMSLTLKKLKTGS